MNSRSQLEHDEGIGQSVRKPNRELSRRCNAGIEVVLLWRQTTGELTVCVTDQREGTYLELHPPPELALDVFNHPYFYADRGHPYYEDARLAA
jgi:hypothetical protein